MLEVFAFFCLKSLIILCALLTVSVYNPVHSVLFLVAVFIFVSMLLLFCGMEFLAFAFLIVYIGAISVLFLFVVMMLDIPVPENNNRASNITTILFISMCLIIIPYTFAYWLSDVFHIAIRSPISSLPLIIDSHTNLMGIGIYVFTQVPLSFLMVGLILFVAMCGAIVLTLRHGMGIRRQQVFQQNSQKQFILTLKP